jgi:hypothetical protein
VTYATTGYLGDFVLVEPIADSLEGTGYEGLGHKKRADPIGPALGVTCCLP